MPYPAPTQLDVFGVQFRQFNGITVRPGSAA
jgi:hypothetical protein